MLRDYQQRSIDMLYAWFERNPEGHPCLVLPTGSGKSWIIAGLCRDALQNWPETRVLMLTHQKELIQQNAEKMRAVWRNAPLGIYSASLGRRDAGEPITFAGIQSVRDKAAMLGWCDLVIIDECHLMNNEQQGGYRKLLADLEEINPGLRVIGLTATPWRLGQGVLTQGDDALFTDIIEPVTIEELLFKNYLAPLRSKQTETRLDVSGVKKRGGEFIESELARAVDNEMCNQQAVQEIIRRAGDRQSWLVFCAGVDHAQHIRDEIALHGIGVECLTGSTPKRQREEMLAAFKAKEIRALTNANILTTGFDAPDTDLVAMLRPTMSPALYVQMAGRGLRPKSHTDHCLVLDFAENVARHGPITCVEPPKKKGNGEAPVKVCPECNEVLHLSAKQCPECGHEFVAEEDEKRWRLANDDIMGEEGSEMTITDWRWLPHTSRSSGKEMIRVTYYGTLSDPPVTEYLPILHPGFAGQKAMMTLAAIANGSGARVDDTGLPELCDALNSAAPPFMIEYRKDGKFHRVIRREWNGATP
jgi:DNA repair protein RadD